MVMSRAAYTRHLTETGPIIRMAEMPKTVTTRALKLCSPPSTAPADNAFDRGTARPNSDKRVPSPTTFPATPNCPIPSEINCATKLRGQERPLISQVNACLQAHVLANCESPPKRITRANPQPTACSCFQTAPGPLRKTKYPSRPKPSRAAKNRREPWMRDCCLGAVPPLRASLRILLHLMAFFGLCVCWIPISAHSITGLPAPTSLSPFSSRFTHLDIQE